MDSIQHIKSRLGAVKVILILVVLGIFASGVYAWRARSLATTSEEMQFATSTSAAVVTAQKIKEINLEKFLSDEERKNYSENEREAVTGTLCSEKPVGLLSGPNAVQYADLTGDGVYEAVVNYLVCNNGTGGGQSRVFTLNSSGALADITPDLRDALSSTNLGEGNQFEGHGYFHISNSKLTFDLPIYKNGEGNCCPTGGNATINLIWNGSDFVADTIDIAGKVSIISIVSQETKILNTVDWKTYSSAKYGFEFKYPSNLVVEFVATTTGEQTARFHVYDPSFDSDGKIGQDVRVEMDEVTFTLFPYTQEVWFRKANSRSTESAKNAGTVKSITIEPHDAYIAAYEFSTSLVGPYFMAYLTNSEFIFEVYAVDHNELAEAMLTTFKFSR